jgi:hypothetical protein
MDLGMSIIHRSPRKRTNVAKALNTLGVDRLLKPETAKSRATPHQAPNITKNVSAAEPELKWLSLSAKNPTHTQMSERTPHHLLQMKDFMRLSANAPDELPPP